MTTLAQDSFIRANQSNWGTASDGVNVWGSAINSSGPTTSIVSDEGTITNGNSTDAQVICGSNTASAINILIRTKTTDTANLNGVLWRYSSGSFGNGYRAGFYGGTSFNVDKYTNGGRSNIASASVSYNANDFWWIRLIHDSGNTLQIRWWKDGTSEPSNFNSPFINQSETSYTSAGNFGVSVYLNGAAPVVSYDSYTVTDNQSSGGSATKSAGLRTLVRTQVSKSTGLRTLIRTQKTLSSGLRALVRTQKTVSTGLRALIGTAARKSAPLRSLVRTQKTLSAGLRSLVRTQKSVATTLRTLVRTLRTQSLNMRTPVRTQRQVATSTRIPVRTQRSQSTQLRTPVRSNKTVSSVLRSLVQTRAVRSIAMRIILRGRAQVVPLRVVVSVPQQKQNLAQVIVAGRDGIVVMSGRDGLGIPMKGR